MSASPGPPAPDPAGGWARVLADISVCAHCWAPVAIVSIDASPAHYDWDGRKDHVCVGAAVPAPPAALTVERLREFAQEFLESRPATLVEAFRRSPAQYVQDFAAWLLPRLGSVSPGAPAAARLAPLRQEFREALALFQEAAGGVAVGSAHVSRIRLDHVLSEYERALRAALAAARDGPA